jgi:hypothetical protein
MTWLIIPILILMLWLYLKFKQTMKHKTIIGKQVLVEYFDQNTNFETIFPLTGTVTQKIKVGSQDFFVVQFASSFVYESYNFDKIVIKERHAGHYIGADGEIHVHVCLPRKELKQEIYELTDFDHVVWATIKNL